MRRATTVLIDLAVVVGFVAIGRSSHDEGNALLGLADTTAPFLLALAVGWGAVLVLGWDPASVRAGGVVWLATWGVGLMLRGVFFGGGTAAAFVLVAAVALAVGLVGWRALRAAATQRAARDQNRDRT